MKNIYKFVFILTLANFLSCCLFAKSITIAGTTAHTISKSIALGDTVFVPINSIAKSYGMQSSYNYKTKVASLKSTDYTLYFPLNSRSITINGHKATMKAPTRLVRNKIYLPAVFGENQLKNLLITHDKKGIKNNKRKTFLIVLDPGHGGNDYGTISKNNTFEKTINLKISLYLKSILEANGFKVMLTRSNDKFITLWRRTYFAQKNNADLFISIHANSAPNKKARGIEIFYYGRPSKKFNGPNYKRNHLRSSFLAKILAQYLPNAMKTDNRGAKTARFYVIKNAKTPSVLIETGFLSNIHDEKRLKSKDYQKKFAKEIANTIMFYHRKIAY